MLRAVKCFKVGRPKFGFEKNMYVMKSRFLVLLELFANGMVIGSLNTYHATVDVRKPNQIWFGLKPFGLVCSVFMIVRLIYKMPKSERSVAIFSIYYITERSKS